MARRQAYAPASTAASRSSAMLRPVTTTTSGPVAALDAPRHHPGDRSGAGALGDDPVRAREEADRLLDLGLGDRHDRGDVVAHELERDRAGLDVAASPSAIVSPTSIGVIAPAASALENAGERSASTATTRAPGRPAAHRPRPDARLPPPSGQATVGAPGSWASSSRPIVDCPAITPVSL